jgi:UDP-N-acetylmuramate dehydrogenase
VGDAQVSAHHANFIVNRGRATARDITTLMERIQDRVWETARIRLEPEVVVIGEER